MTSNIDPTKPPEGDALTSDVRANFQTAKSEIEAIQAWQNSRVIVTGQRKNTDALASLLTVLDNLGLIEDRST